MNRVKDITIVVLFIAVVYLLGTRDLGSDAEEVQESPSPSIAVLPFDNMTGDAGNEYFSDGISIAVFDALAKAKDLKVASQRSSFAFKGTNEDYRTLGMELGVSYILEGAIRKEGASVRVWVQLIRVDDGLHLWVETYDRAGDAVETIPSEIAKAIATVTG